MFISMGYVRYVRYISPHIIHIIIIMGIIKSYKEDKNIAEIRTKEKILEFECNKNPFLHTSFITNCTLP